MKRVLSIVLAIIMLLSVAPLSFAEEHPSYETIQINDKEHYSYYMDSDNHYYKNDAASCTDNPDGANVSYEQETGILILDNFDGGTIRINGVGDVTIMAKGTNNINGWQFGIYAPSSNLTLTSEENAVINISNQTDDSAAIVTTWSFANDNSITISGNLTVNIDTAIHSNKDYTGIRAGGKLSILDNANFTVKGTSDTDYCHVRGLQGASLELNTTGTVNVETTGAKYYFYALSFTSAQIKNVKSFNIKSSGENRECIVYNDDVYNTLINTPGFEAIAETDESNNYYLTIAKHIHSYIDSNVEPTATALGYTLHTCACGVSYKDNFKAPTGKPASFKCTARTAAAMKFTWAKTGGVTGYQVQILNAKGGNAGLKELTGNAYTFTKLTAGYAYKARVRFYIKAEDGKNYYGAWTTINSPTLPAGTSITKLTPASKAFTAQWKKGACTGYQLQYSLKSNFSGAKTVTIKNVKTLKYTLKKLNAKKTYYVRVRTYKTINKANYFSAWSAVKKVVTK